MDDQLRMLRRLFVIQLASIPLYAWIAEFIARGSSKAISPEIHSAFAILGVGLAGAAFVLYQRMVSRNFEVLHTQPDNVEALTQAKVGYILAFSFCEAIALFGVALRMLGASTKQAALFFAAAAILLLLFYPRRP